MKDLNVRNWLIKTKPNNGEIHLAFKYCVMALFE